MTELNNISNASLRIIIAGGGTGGHIFPAIAIANALVAMQPGIDILFVGAKGKMEMEKVPQAGYKIEGLNIAGYNRSSILKNLKLPFKLINSFFQVGSILKSFKPDAVIGVGGYSSFPVLRYAQSKNIPTFIHESNSFAGKSNILLGKKATKIFTVATGMEKFFPKEKIMVTGNPVRANIVKMDVSREDAINFFGLNSSLKTILSIGGSLGAQKMNDALSEGLKFFADNEIQLIWQTGKIFYEQAKEIAKPFPNVKVFDFLSDMDKAYAAADVVISRSGAMAKSELCLAEKPVIFVPYPFAAEDHQTANAMQLVNAEAALLVTDKDAEKKLVSETIALVKDELKQNNLKKNIKKFGVGNADQVIATQILNEISIVK